VTQSLLGRVSAGENLAQDQMAAAVEVIVQGAWSEGEIGVFLTALAAKGETEAELAGAAAALRRHMTPIRSKRTGLLDTCGTGGDRSRTFNISTAAALVVAAAGVPVAKHGNRRITSSSGSADVLAALGVNVEATVAQVEACLDEVGIGFCFAPLHHPGVKRVAAVRRKLGVPTIFNLLGPLCNPASAPYQLLGVSKPQHRLLLARALALLGTTRALVVWGEDGLDEVTLSAATRVTQVQNGRLVDHRWTPEEFGIARAPRDELVVEGPQESAAMIRSVFAGEPGPARDIVVLNAAAALYVVAAAADLRQAAGLAAAAIDSGATGRLLTQLSETSHRG